MADPEAAPAFRRRMSSVLDVPAVALSAVRLVWTASRGRALLILGVQVVASLSLVAQVLLIDAVLAAVLGVAGTGSSAGAAVLPIVALAGLTVVTSVATTVGDLQERILGELVAREVWREVLEVSEEVDLASYEDPAFYDQAERVHVGAAQRTQLVVQGLVLLVGDALGVLGAAAAVLWLAPSLLPLLLLSGVPIFLTSRLAGRREFDFAVQQSAPNRARGYLQSVLTQRATASEVRAFSVSPALRRNWETNYGVFLGDLRRHVGKRIRLALAGNVAAAILVAVALFTAVMLVEHGELDVASAGAALVAVRLLGNRVGGATLGLSTIFEAALFLRDLKQFLGRRPARIPVGSRSPAPDGFDRLEASGVSFTYPGATRPALTDVSLEIRAGEVVALVGENGSGKSTLAKLLANLYRPDDGRICWDGVDAQDLDPADVRRRTSVLFQDFIRYQLTARANISLGRGDDEADERAVREAAVKADADRFLSGLPAGYDTFLSKEYQGGTDLSLGQWQRVALARALVRDAPFIILDEPSASLDARAEHDLFDRMRALASGRTVLLISHRFSTVRSADRIYVLSHGRVVEQGDHAGLMERRGVYAELFQLQASSYLTEDRVQRS